MQDKHLYEYAVIRVLPRVDREEFLNVGVIVYCATQNFLRAECSLDEQRFRAFGVDVLSDDLKEHLSSVCSICSGDSNSGPIGKLSLGERFRWLTAPRSTVVQTSPVHTGLTNDPEETLKELIKKLVK